MQRHSIENLRDRYRVEKAELERRIEAITAKLQVLDELATEERGVLATSDPGLVPTDDRLPIGLTLGCAWVVNKHGLGTSLKTTDVRNYLLQYGYQPKGKNFPVTLFKTLKRLRNQGRIGGEKTGSTWAFHVK
jgi:hypothetical protein